MHLTLCAVVRSAPLVAFNCRPQSACHSTVFLVPTARYSGVTAHHVPWEGAGGSFPGKDPCSAAQVVDRLPTGVITELGCVPEDTWRPRTPSPLERSRAHGSPGTCQTRTPSTGVPGALESGSRPEWRSDSTGPFWVPSQSYRCGYPILGVPTVIIKHMNPS